MKPEGKNEIQVVGNSDFRCWKYGNWLTLENSGNPITNLETMQNSASGIIWDPVWVGLWQ